MELNLEELTRDEEFWFEDGNIVLVAGNIAFKVFKGLLAAQSKVLGDMVAAGDPGAGQMLEGCPVVRLFDDSPLEVRYLLRVLVPKGDIMYASQSRVLCNSSIDLQVLSGPGCRLELRLP